MAEKRHWLSRWMTHRWRIHPEVAHALVSRHIFRYLLYVFLGMAFYGLLPWISSFAGHWLFEILRRSCLVFSIGCLLMVFNGLLLSVLDLYNTKDRSRSRPMKGLVQVFQVLLFFVGGIFIVSVLVDKSPATLFAGLGASAAIFMLVFKDSILGFVAGVQLSVNDMVRLGDWIQLPDGSANGVVFEITLNTVKIRNWDNTISTIPPYTLVNTTFRNWRGMQESAGRRVDKSIRLDADSLRCCTAEEMERLRSEVPLMAGFNVSSGEMPTNTQLYRFYIGRYLRIRPEVNTDLDLIISQKEPTQYGVPIEVYFFLRNKEWSEFEQLQSDIFDHLLVMAGTFGLKLYQLSGAAE